LLRLLCGRWSDGHVDILGPTTSRVLVEQNI
jgi:hypothetical protein